MPGLIENLESRCEVPESDWKRLTDISTDLAAIKRNETTGPPLPTVQWRQCRNCQHLFTTLGSIKTFCWECNDGRHKLR